MSSSGEHVDSKADKRPRKGVLCAKCEHLNPPSLGTCERCHSHLFVTCGDCGTRNERVRTRCSDCGRKLHRSLWQRIGRRTFGRPTGVTPTAVFFFLAGVAIVFGIIVLISNISLPGFR